MTSPDEQVAGLAEWFRENSPRLRHESSAVVADELGEEVLRIHEQLGVEVGDDDPDRREVIVTAFSEPTLFSLVHDITERLSTVPGWRLVALKPPRGFKFKLALGSHRIDASSLEFARIPDLEGGVQLAIPPTVFESLPTEQNLEELAWLVVETGIGEELAGRLEHLEFAVSSEAKDRYPIDALEAYVRENMPHRA